MVLFVPDEKWEHVDSRGRPSGRVIVPQVLAGWLDQTYRDQTVCLLPAEADEDGVQELLRAGSRHATRQGLRFQWSFGRHQDQPVLKLRMRDRLVRQQARRAVPPPSHLVLPTTESAPDDDDSADSSSGADCSG